MSLIGVQAYKDHLNALMCEKSGLLPAFGSLGYPSHQFSKEDCEERKDVNASPQLNLVLLLGDDE